MFPRPACLIGAIVARRLCALIPTLSVTALLCVATQSSAQDAPRFVEFDPSADHDALLVDGRPVVSSYEIEFVLDGAAAPFQVADIGKPAPGSDGKVLHDLSMTPVGWPIAGATYEVFVSAMGPNGTGRSDPSPPFVVGSAAPNAPPTVSLTSPLHASTFPAPASIGVTAAASDADGTIARVDFYRDAVLVASDTTAPYAATATGLPAGTYTFTASAVDNAGASQTSTAAVVTVAAANAAPAVALTTPVAGAAFSAPASISMSANATDGDGTVARVEFYNGGALVGTDTTAPYTATVTGVAAGTYSLTAKAVDNQGASTTSAVVSITVAAANAAPSVALVTPAEGATLKRWRTISVKASASDSDGTVARVEFYRGAVLVGTDTTSPYAVTMAGVAAGTYSLTAKAVDNAGASTVSAPVRVTVR